MFRIAKSHEKAVIPCRGRPGDAGMDLFACEALTIAPHDRGLVNVGIVIEIPEDCYARIAPRSGLAVRSGIQVGAGVVDCTYRGTIKVLLFNHGSEPFDVRVGDRIAQIIFEKIYPEAVFEEVADPSELSDTTRGAGGFGSSGAR